MTSTSSTSSRGSLAGLWLASAAVLTASVLASFRLAFGDDFATPLVANGPRVLLAAGVGAAFGLAGALRLQLEREGPLRGLVILAVSAGAAGGGFAGAEASGDGLVGGLGFAVGAALGGGALYAAARFLDRPQRWTNVGAAGLLAAGIGIAALAGAYSRERQDVVSGGVAWLLGDLSGATAASGAAVLLAAVALVVWAQRAAGDAARLGSLALVALGVGVGAAGLLAFVGSLVPRAVRALSPGASVPARLATSAVAGAATVAAIDAVPRLLVGGYDFAFNVAAGMLAIPAFLGWNRMRLRRLAGPVHPVLEVAELLLIGGMTAAGVALVVLFTRIIAVAT